MARPPLAVTGSAGGGGGGGVRFGSVPMLEIVQGPPLGWDGGRVPLNRPGQAPVMGSSDMSAEPKRPPSKQIMTIAELADYLGTSPMEVRRLFRSRKAAGFPGFKLRNKWCVTLEDVQDWLLAMADELADGT